MLDRLFLYLSIKNDINSVFSICEYYTIKLFLFK